MLSKVIEKVLVYGFLYWIFRGLKPYWVKYVHYGSKTSSKKEDR
jgi:hypothetical protein